MRNERGYVLLNVLVIIILVVAFGMMLIPKTVNTSLQIQKTEGNSQSKDMSEMGIHYAHAYLQTLVAKAIEESKKDTRYINNTINHDTLFCEKMTTQITSFNSVLPKSIVMDANIDHSFQIKYFEPYTLTPRDTTKAASCDNYKNFSIPIESIGKVLGKSEKSVKAYFIIENKAATGDGSGGSGSGPGPGTGTGTPVDPNTLPLVSVTNPNDTKLSGNAVSKMFSSAHFYVPVIIGGNGKLMVGGHAWFEGREASNKLFSVTFNGNNGILVVSGDAYFKYPVSLGGNQTNYVCIRGNAYILRSGTTNTWDDYSSYLRSVNSCPPLIEKEVQYFYDLNEWGIIESNLNVIY
jgi:hypothetical protein